MSYKINDALIEELLSPGRERIRAYVEDVETIGLAGNKKIKVRCNYVALDGNGRTKVFELIDFLAKRAVHFVFPNYLIQQRLKEATISGDTSPVLELVDEAKRLFSKQNVSGEGGELLLYQLTEEFLKYPQVFNKFPLKTNPNVHVHGSDGIYGSIGEDGHLRLHWGESKLHKTFSKSVKECMESIGTLLNDNRGGDSIISNELRLMTSFFQNPDEKLLNAVKSYFDRKHPLNSELEYCGVCLVGFNWKFERKQGRENKSVVKKEIEKAMKKWVPSIENRISDNSLSSFVLDVFVFPIPNVNDFREQFKKKMVV